MCTDLLPKPSNGLNHPWVSHLGHLEVCLEGQVSYGTPLHVCLATFTSYQNVLSSTIFHNALALHKGWDRQRCTSAELRKAPFFTLRWLFKPLLLWQFHVPIKPATNPTLTHLPPLLISHFVQHTYKPWKKKSLVSVIWLSSLTSSMFFNSKTTNSRGGLLHFLMALPFCFKGYTGSLSDVSIHRLMNTNSVSWVYTTQPL